jgi:nucleoside-diphosphate-sugar epimerase
MHHLIFGGSGFIGTHLKAYLLGIGVGGNDITKYDIAKKASDDFEVMDVRKPIEIKKDLQNTIIYNLAAVHTTPGHPNNEYFETNILGAENVCNFARQNNIDTIVFTSSIAPYGPSEDFKTEDSIPMPNIPYGISKLTAEYIHKLWQKEKPDTRRLIIVRPGVVFGKDEGGNFTRLYQSLKKGFFFYPGRKDTIKAAVYVKDVVRILFETGQKELPGVSTFNLSLYPAPTIETICQTMAKVTGVNPPKLLVPAWIMVSAARMLYFSAWIFGKKINGIHPERVRKLMISTNISGEKLSKSRYMLKFNLEEAIKDWYKDCGGSELA